MPIEVEGPDGRVHTFPDNTDQGAIMAQMASLYGGGPGGSLRPQSLPRAGDATAASGAIMPSMASTPPYMSNEDWDRVMLSQMFPNAQGTIANTPGAQFRTAQAQAAGKNLAELEERQRAGRHMLNLLHGLVGNVASTPDPNRPNDPTARVAHPALDAAIGPLNSRDWWQSGREIANVGNIMGTRAGYDLHNRLSHGIHALTTAFTSAAKAGNMSNDRQAVFTDTMGAMMHATNYDDFMRILADADHFIRENFGLAPGANVPRQPSRTATAAPAGPQREQFRNRQTGKMETFQWNGQSWDKVN